MNMRIIKIMIPCVLLGACMFGTSKNAKFYTLSATAMQPVSASYAEFVGVNRIQLPKYVDRPQIVTQQKNSAQVNISEYNRWVESPAVLASRVVTEDVSVLLPNAQIKMSLFRGEKFDKTVTVEIIKMDAVLGEQAELAAWCIVKDKAGKIQAREKFEYTLPVGKTYDEFAQSVSQLLAQLSQEIARLLIQP
ncbi:MAG: membrane integrity-associated transporter subunit PqiC [Elusimicrobiaceae bacterium]|nr:membrane integrity-associated transporter subunit PqiC [Elusimicrobiaceae bacterium]